MATAHKVKKEEAPDRSQIKGIGNFIMVKNSAMQKYQFQPRKENLDDYEVSFAEVNGDDEKAWEALQSALNTEENL